MKSEKTTLTLWLYHRAHRHDEYPRLNLQVGLLSPWERKVIKCKIEKAH